LPDPVVPVLDEPGLQLEDMDKFHDAQGAERAAFNRVRAKELRAYKEAIQRAKFEVMDLEELDYACNNLFGGLTKVQQQDIVNGTRTAVYCNRAIDRDGASIGVNPAGLEFELHKLKLLMRNKRLLDAVRHSLYIVDKFKTEGQEENKRFQAKHAQRETWNELDKFKESARKRRKNQPKRSYDHKRGNDPNVKVMVEFDTIPDDDPIPRPKLLIDGCYTTDGVTKIPKPNYDLNPNPEFDEPIPSVCVKFLPNHSDDEPSTEELISDAEKDDE